jgi:hypothetical protein
MPNGFHAFILINLYSLRKNAAQPDNLFSEPPPDASAEVFLTCVSRNIGEGVPICFPRANASLNE